MIWTPSIPWLWIPSANVGVIKRHPTSNLPVRGPGGKPSTTCHASLCAAIEDMPYTVSGTIPSFSVSACCSGGGRVKYFYSMGGTYDFLNVGGCNWRGGFFTLDITEEVYAADNCITFVRTDHQLDDLYMSLTGTNPAGVPTLTLELRVTGYFGGLSGRWVASNPAGLSSPVTLVNNLWTYVSCGAVPGDATVSW